MKTLILAALALTPVIARADAACTLGQVTQTCEYYNHETWTTFTYDCELYDGAPTLILTCHTSYVSPSRGCSGTVKENSCH